MLFHSREGVPIVTRPSLVSVLAFMGKGVLGSTFGPSLLASPQKPGTLRARGDPARSESFRTPGMSLGDDRC
jgi:hypothetical protein